jgi:hypothetical protein
VLLFVSSYTVRLRKATLFFFCPSLSFCVALGLKLSLLLPRQAQQFA